MKKMPPAKQVLDVAMQTTKKKPGRKKKGTTDKEFAAKLGAMKRSALYG